MDKMKLYYSLPVPLQQAACCAEGMRIERTRYGRAFREAAARYRATGEYAPEALRAYQNQRLQKMIRHCYDTVPYYTEEFDRLGLKPADIQTVEDLPKLPVLTKNEARANLNRLISAAIPERKRYIHPTGGTTGAGLSFWTTHEEESEQWAVWWRYRNRLGIRRGMWCGLFTGKIVVATDSWKPPYWRVNLPGRQVYFSPYHMNEETVSLYADALKKRNIQWLHGYPSAISELARLMLKAGIECPMKRVTVGSEGLTENQSRLIESAFHAKPYQHYGLTEGVANFSQWPDGAIRVDEDFSLVEFVNRGVDDNSVIGTTLTNFAMPLLRFDTGDLAALADCQDGAFRIVSRIVGREDDYITGVHGSKVTAAGLSLIFLSPHIAQSQIIQKSVSHIQVNVVRMPGYTQEDEADMLKRFHDRLGHEMQVDIRYCETLPRTKSGKVKLVIHETESGE